MALTRFTMSLRPAVLLIVVLMTSPGAVHSGNLKFHDACSDDDDQCNIPLACKDEKCQPGEAKGLCRIPFPSPGGAGAVCIMCRIATWAPSDCDSYELNSQSASMPDLKMDKVDYQKSKACQKCISQKEHAKGNHTLTLVIYDGEIINANQRAMHMIYMNFHGDGDASKLYYNKQNDIGLDPNWAKGGSAGCTLQVYPLLMTLMAAAAAYYNVA